MKKEKRLFELGRCVVTVRAARTIPGFWLGTMLHRHQRGDWGVVCEADARANEVALEEGLRILSVYVVDTERVYVLTEADRSATTIMSAEEY